jgi:hypothetical protein
MRLDHFEKRLPIDTRELVNELARQADLFWQLCQETTAATSKADRESQAHRVTRAELQPNVRSNLHAGKGKPPTEEEVKSALDINASIIRARDAELEAMADALLWRGMQDAWRQRHECLIAIAHLQQLNTRA